MIMFEGMGSQMKKWIINFSVGNGVPNTVFKFFLQETSNWMKAEEQVLRAHFPVYQWFYLPIISKNNKVHPWVDPHQPYEFHENWFKSAPCIMRSYYVKYKKYTSSKKKIAETGGEVGSFWFVTLSVVWKRKVGTTTSCFNWSTSAIHIQLRTFFVFTRKSFFWTKYTLESVFSYIIRLTKITAPHILISSY